HVAGWHRLSGVAPVEQLVPELVRKNLELLSGVQSREDLDLAALAAPERAGELVDVGELDALGIDEVAKLHSGLTGVSADLRELRQRLSVRGLESEYVDDSKASDGALVVLGVLPGDDGGHDADALLA